MNKQNKQPVFTKTSIDVEKELMDILAAELSQEIDREIMNTIFPNRSSPKKCYE